VHNTLQPLGSLIVKKKKGPSNGARGGMADDEENVNAEEEEQVVVSTLVVGCRKKVAVMAWSGGKPLGGTKVSIGFPIPTSKNRGNSRLRRVLRRKDEVNSVLALEGWREGQYQCPGPTERVW
jgi:hypothetical protein